MTYIYALVSLASIAAICIYIFWLYRDFRVDQFRQQMFCLRDRLFDDAMNGTISFNDEAYGVLRVMMNGFIRFAHLVSLSNFIATTLWLRGQNVDLPSLSGRLEKNLRDLPTQQRAKYNEYKFEMHRLVVRHLLLNSPISLVTIVIPASCYFIAAEIIDRTINKAKSQLERMDSMAYVAADPN